MFVLGFTLYTSIGYAPALLRGHFSALLLILPWMLLLSAYSPWVRRLQPRPAPTRTSDGGLGWIRYRWRVAPAYVAYGLLTVSGGILGLLTYPLVGYLRGANPFIGLALGGLPLFVSIPGFVALLLSSPEARQRTYERVQRNRRGTR